MIKETGMSKTPRTDEHCRKISDDALGLEYVANELQYWAEKLEEELAAAQAEIAALKNEYICKCGLRVTPHRCKTGEEF